MDGFEFKHLVISVMKVIKLVLLQGTFYGTNHGEVDDTFNRNDIIGAFGAVK